MASDEEFFKNRREGKLYISKLFTWNEKDLVGKRNVTMVLDGSDELYLGEIEGALALRLTGNKRRTQVTAIVTQDDSCIRRVTLQTFKDYGGDAIWGMEKEEFTFRQDELERLLSFLDSMAFIDLQNKENFQIEDLSKGKGNKLLVDSEHKGLISSVQGLEGDDRERFLSEVGKELSDKDLDVLLGRSAGLAEYAQQLEERTWSEKDWQAFFEREDWVFGYGLDYRISKSFDREVNVGTGGTDNKNKPIVDFLRTFTDYSVLVEIKKPDTRLFRASGGRSGTRAFSTEFVEAISQILEQKAEWQILAQTGEHYSRDGTKCLTARTRNVKSILVIGSKHEFAAIENGRERQIAMDTFELFRREQESIDIITFDELYERASFIVK